MVIDTVHDLVETLRYERLLEQPQLEQLDEEFLSHFDCPRALARYLAQLDWLTIYQVNHLFEGQGQDLMIGPYRILDRLGEGGVSEVYKAWHTEMGRPVALKVLREGLTTESDAVRQFQREMQAVTRLSHPNVINTIDAGQEGTVHYFAMELVEGTDLRKVVQLSGPLSIGEACDFIRQVASGLQHAHQLGLVHRDIKPANLFLIHPPGFAAPRPGVSWRRPKDPVIKIIDWGLARLRMAEEEGDDCAPDVEEGMLVGTADYIAPEQARDPRLVDIRADIYSLGCTFYYLLAGEPPFPGSSAMQKIMQHQNEEPRPIREHRPDVPDELATIIHKMMGKQPEGRYQIPLAILVPLRKFSQSSNSYNGLTLRPSANGTAMRPSSHGSGLRPGVGSNHGNGDSSHTGTTRRSDSSGRNSFFLRRSDLKDD